MATGGCLCGGVRYETSAAIEEIDHCHCTMCRRFHGAAFATNGRLSADALKITAGQEQLRVYRSSKPVERSFCGTCGASLFYRNAYVPEAIFVAIASLDEDPGLRATMHLFTGSKAPWFEITDDLPQHEAFPPGVGD